MKPVCPRTQEAQSRPGSPGAVYRPGTWDKDEAISAGPIKHPDSSEIGQGLWRPKVAALPRRPFQARRTDVAPAKSPSQGRGTGGQTDRRCPPGLNRPARPTAGILCCWPSGSRSPWSCLVLIEIHLNPRETRKWSFSGRVHL
ncbi:uncharacterized protein LOC120585688 [Pteropus medius]|uniref:uncharacterized protein LOC120585688 n=1 Tax=Pteropus vampyrus TaxID=132908 RepID=UPI00196AD3F8|nr:uncharacterized protein LOC120585688 [Pteropus giganteus]